MDLLCVDTAELLSRVRGHRCAGGDWDVLGSWHRCVAGVALDGRAARQFCFGGQTASIGRVCRPGPPIISGGAGRQPTGSLYQLSM